MRSTLLFVLLMIFYALLSGQFHSSYLMIVGAIACAAIVALTSHMDGVDEESVPAEYWLRTMFYVPWLLWQIILANIDVARWVWSGNLNISPCLVRLPHRLKSPYGIATYANSITLTPGTVTLEANESQLLVHALTHEAAQDLLDGEMLRHVQNIENGSSRS